MFCRLRILALVMVCAASASAQAPAPKTPAQAPKDEVFMIERDGRKVYTNAGSVQVRGSHAEAMELPELGANLDVASPAQLQLLDNSVQRAHDDLQQGARCQAIRASLRVPMRSFFLRGHLREVCVGAGLLALALLLMMAWHGRLRSLMPVAPLLGCLYLGYATYARVDSRMDMLREGLRACSSDLPPQGRGVSDLRGRLEQATSLQATIDRAYAQRASLSESAMRER